MGHPGVDICIYTNIFYIFTYMYIHVYIYMLKLRIVVKNESGNIDLHVVSACCQK